MYLLKLLEGDRAQYIGLFESLESGRAFMKKVPGYKYSLVEEGEYSFEEEIIEYQHLPDIVMTEYNNFRVPLSRFSFEGDVIVVWIELDNLDEKNELAEAEKPKISTGATRVDAYSVNNEEVKSYIERREEKYRLASNFLDELGYEVDRACFGSEDGEAIFIRKKTADEQDWHFFTHLDPGFVFEALDEGAIIEELKSY